MCLLIFYFISVFQCAVCHHCTCFMTLFQGHVKVRIYLGTGKAMPLPYTNIVQCQTSFFKCI